MWSQQERPAVPPGQFNQTPGTLGQERQIPEVSEEFTLKRKLPDVHVLAEATQADFATLGNCPAPQATAAATPPAQADPEGQGKHPVEPTR